MALIIARSWIPRSYVHVQEVFNNVKHGMLGLDYSNLEINNEVSFVIASYEKFKNIKFSLDSDGLYSLSADAEATDAKYFTELMKKLLLEVIIKSSHSVTYSQIKTGILPLNFHTTVYSKKMPEKPESYQELKHGNLRIYLNRKEEYLTDTFVYANEEYDRVFNHYAFCVLISHFYYKMMDKMSEYYTNAEKTVNLLESKNLKLGDLKESLLSIDLIEKDVSESKSKIEQSIDSLERKKENYKTIASRNKQLTLLLGLDDYYEKINSDRDYLNSLWDLLINYLGNVDASVEARMSWQESVEARKIEAFMSIQNSGILAALIVGAVFVTGSTLLANWLLVIIFVIIEYTFYKLILFNMSKPTNKKN